MASTSHLAGCYSPVQPPPLRSFLAAALVLSLGCIAPAVAVEHVTGSTRYYYVSSKTKGVHPSPYTGSFRVSVKMTEFSQLVQYTLRVFGLPQKPKATFSQVGIFKGQESATGPLVASFPCRMRTVITGWVCFGEARKPLDKSWTPKFNAAALISGGVYDTPGNFYVSVTYSGATSASGGSNGTIRGQLVG
ncbi:hypothetical protein CLOM_g14424 [Closterium sp. NIES-68]|nr:hypothetical protein CLOM_g14424 [Closterium sp. NIES-68]GJP78396.1 hypothetical protein CLOP_g8698 [Closterium sp. NIES-67]